MCEHNTTIVKYDQGNVQIEVCTWGCGQTIISVKGADTVTESFTVREIVALRARVEALEAAAAKLVNCHEQDEDNCVHAKDINVAVYYVPSKFDRDKALEDLAFILGAAALK